MVFARGSERASTSAITVYGVITLPLREGCFRMPRLVSPQEPLESGLISTDGSEHVLAKHSKTETDEGTALVKEFLNEWRERVEAEGLGAGVGGLEDIKGGEKGGSGSGNETRQLEILREVVKEYEERLGKSPWVQSLLEGI